MYELKLLTPKFDIPKVDCIYKINQIGQFTDELCNNQAQKSCGFDLNILEKKIQLAAGGSPALTSMIVERQVQVIQQLEALQAKLTSIREKCKLSAPLPVMKMTSKNVQCEDFVINAHPNQVPYTLLALHNFCKNNLNFDIRVFKHSSVAKLGKEAQYFEQQLAAHNRVNQNLPTIKISLIWMESVETVMISSEAKYMSIYGEVNILRYLARIGTPNLSYEHLSAANEIDSILDNCHQVLRLRTLAARKAFLNAISAYLNDDFLFEKQITLADIMVYCTIKQAVPTKDLNFSTKDLNTQFKLWRNRVENIIAI